MKFSAACEKVRDGSFECPAATKLRLYGLYKRVHCGEAPAMPLTVDPTQLAKWQAWKHASKTSQDDAALEYIAIVKSL